MSKAEASSYEYHSYLLRLWRRGATWQVILESIASGERLVFADLDGLVEFLAGETAGDNGEEQLPA